MTLPLVLVVDDQFARDPSERLLFLRKARLRERGTHSGLETDFIAEAVFCSGQRSASGGRLVNDFAVVSEAVAAAGEGAWALVLLDMRFDSGPISPDGEPEGLLGDDDFGERIRSRMVATWPNLPVVVLTSKRHADLDQPAVAYLAKDGLDRHGMASCMVRHARLQPDQLRTIMHVAPEFVARDEVSVAMVAQAWIAARASHPVLIVGEAGSGKDLLARYIHSVSDRSGDLVTLVSGAGPSSSPDQTQFTARVGGQVFRGIDGERVYELAKNGTLFLEDISEASPEAQTRLLRLLETCDAFPSDAGAPRGRNIRVLASAGGDVRAAVSNGGFRADLYHRVAAERIEVRPLRVRVHDIAALAELFLGQIAGVRGQASPALKEDAVQRLQQYSFPGNVRELRHLMERLSVEVGPHQLVGSAQISKLLADAPPAERAGAARSPMPNAASPGANPYSSPRQDLAAAFAAATGVHRDALTGLLQSALDETRHVGRSRNPDLDDLNPTAAMKLMLGRPDLTTGQAADEIKRIASLTGQPAPDSDFARVLRWATGLRGGDGLRAGRSATPGARG